MSTLTLAEFQSAVKAQGVPRVHAAFVCPMCGTVQSMDCLINAGAGKTEDDVERYVGFSCVGRWLCAGSPRKAPDGKPCNWTLGGLFQCHKLTVLTPDGKRCAYFEVATPEQAKALMSRKEVAA